MLSPNGLGSLHRVVMTITIFEKVLMSTSHLPLFGDTFSRIVLFYFSRAVVGSAVLFGRAGSVNFRSEYG